jgi:hypothetical protein
MFGQESPINRLHKFERLKESAVRIANYPDFPSKAAVIEKCVAEIHGLVRSGSITGQQGVTLLDLLAGGRDDSLSCEVYAPRSAASSE